jgi:hypothetical protein
LILLIIQGENNLKMLCRLIGNLFVALFKGRQGLILENLALRQQLAVQQRSIKRPKINNADRLFWMWLSRIWNNWKSALIVIKPETVTDWHRKGFKHYWRWKSRKVGRPAINWKLIKLIRKLQKENPLWSAQRIQGELGKLGFGLKDTPTAPGSPWQNPICERVIGTFRRECLDHMIVLNEKHLLSVLTEFVEYYNTSRTHMSLGKDAPVHRPAQTDGRIVGKPVLGGLHHVYRRVA